MFTLTVWGSTLDVIIYRRHNLQILTSKVDPRAVRVNRGDFSGNSQPLVDGGGATTLQIPLQNMV